MKNKIEVLRVGIVGCGAIGTTLAKAIARDFQGQAKLSALFDIDQVKAQKLARMVKGKNLAAASLEALIARSDLVIECASARSSAEIAEAVLAKGRDIMVMSVGGILLQADKLFSLAQKCNARIFIPSGAISGVDALKAARLKGIKKVTLTTRKNPLAFKGVEYLSRKKINLEEIRKDTILFSGSALKAIKYFPQNINVSAVLSLAGIGPAKTRVKIVASPSTVKNIHEIAIESTAGRIFTRTENIVHPENPKTSFMAPLSALAVLKGIINPVKIGT